MVFARLRALLDNAARFPSVFRNYACERLTSLYLDEDSPKRIARIRIGPLKPRTSNRRSAVGRDAQEQQAVIGGGEILAGGILIRHSDASRRGPNRLDMSNHYRATHVDPHDDVHWVQRRVAYSGRTTLVGSNLKCLPP